MRGKSHAALVLLLAASLTTACSKNTTPNHSGTSDATVPDGSDLPGTPDATLPPDDTDADVHPTPPDSDQDIPSPPEDAEGSADVREEETDTDADTDTEEVSEGSDPPADGGCATFGVPVVAGNLPSNVNELSGLVTSRMHDNVLWGHNDSGDDAQIFALGYDGTLRATVTLNATARDWEDIAAGPCPQDPTASCLFVGDIGDNLARYADVRVVIFPEPDVADGRIETPTVLRATYPDGAQDAEAMFVTPGPTIWVLTKRTGGSDVMRLVVPDPIPEAPVTFEHVGTISFAGTRDMMGLLTAADQDPRTGRVLLRTYFSVYQLPWQAPEDPWWEGPLERLVSGREVQGEAVAWRGDGYTHAAEGRESRVYYIPCADGSGDE